MFKYRNGFIVIVAFIFSATSYAQVPVGCAGCKTADVNFTEIANYCKAHPEALVRKMPLNEEEEESRKEHRHAPPSEVHLYQPPAQVDDDHYHAPMLPVTAAPNDTFLSTTSSGGAIPPDTHGAVDSQYCVTAINIGIHIQDRVGGNVSIAGLDLFWSSVLPAGTSSFDPKIYYDPIGKRWILVTDAVANPSMTNSTLMIGVSATNDPTGVWHLFSIPVDTTGNSWLDFPNLGYNQKWVAITGNMFPNSFSGMQGAIVYILDYANLKAGTLMTPTVINQGSSFSICPAVTSDVNEPNLYCMEAWSGNNGQLNLWKISGPVGAPTMTHVGYPATSQHWHGGQPGGNDFGPQAGSTHKIDIGDDRITKVQQRNGKLWTSFTAYLPSPGSTNRASIMWWQVDTLANPLQVGLIDDPTAANCYAYSSIAVNKYDDALIGFGAFSGTTHPSGAYAMRLHTDPADSLRPLHIFRHGQASYYTTFGGSQNRWGDYSGSCIDARNDEDFWTIQESSIPGTSANFDTWWANVQICPKPSAPTLITAVAPTCPGDTLTFSINPLPGISTYNWIVSGTGWTGASTDTAITVVAGTTAGTIVAYANNACGQGESLTINVPLLPVPDQPTIYTITAACTGTAVAVFSATAGGGTTYTWQVLGTGWSGVPSGSSINVTVGTGTGYVICDASNACFTGPADTISVIPGTPSARFSESTHSTTTGANVVITYTGGTPPPGSVYTWGFSGGVATPGTGAGPQNVYWTAPGTYVVSLTVNNGTCDSSFYDTVQINYGVGVPEVNAAEPNINVVPNPSEGIFDIVFGKPVNKKAIVKMTDMQGRIVYNHEFNATGANKITVMTDDLADGIYIISVNLDEAIITKKITITR